jgi:hypothetical protein
MEFTSGALDDPRDGTGFDRVPGFGKRAAVARRQPSDPHAVAARGGSGEADYSSHHSLR